MKRYATADPHFGHANIIKHCGRPFSSVEEMDQVMIDNINEVVMPKDELYVIGDFAFRGAKPKDYLDRINCKKVILILGNHDLGDNSDFYKVYPYLELKKTELENEEGRKLNIVLFHYPMRSWNWSFHGSYHLFGHVHNNKHYDKPRELSLNVGVDCHNFKPLSFEEIHKIMKNKDWKNPKMIRNRSMTENYGGTSD